MTQAPEWVIQAEHVGKIMAGKAVLQDVSFSLARGKCLGIMGPNGAGKTTLLNVLSGLWPLSWGTLRRFGSDIGKSYQSDPRIGYLGHHSMLYPDLTARENLLFQARLWGLSHPTRQVDAVLEQVRLSWFAHEMVRTYSRGMKQRLQMARLLLIQPALLLLDEPYTGLDLAGRTLFERILTQRKGDGAAIILISHQMDDVLPLADAIAILARGQFVWWSSVHSQSQDHPHFFNTYAKWVSDEVHRYP
ncbi:MAG: heme ABC exporter ATP-binding protein CcmA [Sulfobacillus thermosulfidooxidans]|uniref:Heme ABC exporter ATP-binding protein CcmA n=1 Tax=Sulfobacillus thermosulfidooxidans TaxID=28034 RepID=A0A2T2WMT8_SULTH|nr:MAG: heme ABC exporter ATP-binding protein CcmA [Sulfobacillus thermosulfidooxidans]